MSFDSEKINEMLHSGPVAQRYTARVGDRLEIDLPRLPLTRYTQYVRLEKEKRGDQDSIVEAEPPDPGEGVLLPRQIVGRAIRPGTVHYVLRAVDRLSGETIPGVDPLDIVVEVEDNE